MRKALAAHLQFSSKQQEKKMKHLSIALLLGVATLASCHTTKNIENTTSSTVTSTSATESTAATVVKNVTKNNLSNSCLTAKVKVEIEGLGKSLSANGTLRMKRDDVVQLTVTFLGVEVGRMEFTPQDVLILDRINKQYVRAAYSEVSFLKKAQLDFYALQSLFWNELFVPGERTAAKATSRFRLSTVNGAPTLTLTDTPQLSYTFLTQSSPSLLTALVVKGTKESDKGEFRFDYSNFNAYNGHQFPCTMHMKVSGTGKDVGLNLSLSRLGNDSSWETRTTVSSKYTRRSVDQVLGQLLK